MKKAFTLAEVLITLAIIGVVAALTIPSVVANTQQQEFKTGLRKAVSVLNSAITMNMAIDGETPYENKNLMGYLMRHMAVIESTYDIRKKYMVAPKGGISGSGNGAFYTTDGMRFEFYDNTGFNKTFPLYENSRFFVCGGSTFIDDGTRVVASRSCGGCGAYGLNSNADNTTKPPCLIMVDVNGDRKPSPSNVNCKEQACSKNNKYKLSDPSGLKLSDVFSIMITDKQAIPYGVAAQKAMYEARK